MSQLSVVSGLLAVYSVCLTRGELSSHSEEYRDIHSALLNECKKMISVMNAMEKMLGDLRWELFLAEYNQESRKRANVYTINALKEEKEHLRKVIRFLVIVLCL